MSYLHVHQYDSCVFCVFIGISVYIIYVGHGHRTENHAGNILEKFINNIDPAAEIEPTPVQCRAML